MLLPKFTKAFDGAFLVLAVPAYFAIKVQILSQLNHPSVGNAERLEITVKKLGKVRRFISRPFFPG